MKAAPADRKLATLLFVDDEPRVLHSMRATFRRDYNVFLAGSGEHALELLDEHPIDVIVSDQRMPSMTGVEVLREVKRRAPRAMRILLTGYADLKAIEAAINESEVFRYLMKPCPVDELREAVAAAVEAAGAGENMGVAHGKPSAPPNPSRTAEPPSVATVTDIGVRTQGSHGARTLASPHVRSATAERVARQAAPDVNVVRVHEAPLTPASRREPAREAREPSREEGVEVLLLTQDSELTEALNRALEGTRVVHAAKNMEQSIGLLEVHSIGVLLTDAAVDEKAVRELTAELKRHVPQLVTIVVSQRSDAQMLIELINYGQIFRFLLKPFHAGQCRLWIDSAVRKHLDLIDHPTTVVRHRVVAHSAPQMAGAVMTSLLARMRQIKQRFVHSEEVT